MGFEIRSAVGGRERPVGGGSRAVLVSRPTLDDVGFLFAVVRRLQRRAVADGATHAGATDLQAAARGSVDALLWVLGATDVAASKFRRGGDLVAGLRPDGVLDLELVAVENLLSVLARTPAEVNYLRGAADAVSFARGWDAGFWWAPLPGPLRPGRDDVGRRVG